MKNYSCRVFKNVDDLLKWLNKEQNYINLVSINYIDNSSFHYEVIFYTEEEVIENKEIEEKDEEKEISTYQYKQNNDGYRSSSLPYSKTIYW